MVTTGKRRTPPMGLEPTTFELEVQRATIAPRGPTTHLFALHSYTLQILFTNYALSNHKTTSQTYIPLTTMN